MNNKKKQPAPKAASPHTDKNINNTATPSGFAVPYPWLLLALAAFIIYFPALSMQFTELDDSIFIREFGAYNEDLGNLLTSFRRGLFDAIKDPYYRPLFLDSIILNYHLSGQNIATYHFINVLLHVGTVLLLYKLLLKLEVKRTIAFILTILFAVHPVLSQAVAWIPGRNDTMLAIFVLSFLIFSIDYTNTGKVKVLALSAIMLLLAFFTKETAVFAGPAAFVLIVFMLNRNWLDKRNITQYAVWLGCFAIWYGARSASSIQSSGIASAQAFTDFIHRLPVIVQYIGKIFLPVNLSVFPTQEDTVYYYGIAAIALLVALIVLNKERNMRIILSGLGVFLLFLMPALLVPAALNEQTFEHRLYLPMIGMLIVLSQSVLLRNKLTEKTMAIIGIGICVLFAGINLKHQQSFSDPLTFWASAAETSPNSAYANMMWAARLGKEDNAKSEELFRKAYRLNPKEKYLNFYLGEMLQNKDSVLASEPYLLAEKNTSGYYQCDFLLARVAMEKKDLNAAIGYLSTYLQKDPGNKPAQTNLLLMYIDTRQIEKAREQAKKMRQMNMEVPPQVLSGLGM